MNQNYEITSFDTFMPLQCTMQKIGRIEKHSHDYFEIDFILSGTCNAVIDNQLFTFEAEDVFTIDGHTPHEISASDCVLITIQFDQSIFEKSLPKPQHPKFNCNSKVQGNNQAFETIKGLIAKIIKNNADQQTGFELRNYSLVYQLMDVLYNNFRVERSIAQDMKSHRYANRVSEIAKIVREHYNESLSLSQLADMVHLSAPYLSKFFDQQFGMTFLAYLTKFRLDHATHELTHTDKIIEEISADSGFPNSHAFVQAFKKEYGILPSVYRRQAKENTNKNIMPTVVQHDYMAGLKKYLVENPELHSATQGVSCNILLNSKDSISTLSHNWKNIMTVGSAAAILISDVQEMIKRTQKEIGFKYIKFTGIFSDDMRVCSRNNAGEIICNFAYIDKIFDFLKSVNLKPFIQLSYMPLALAKNPNRTLFNSIVSEPNSIDEWCYIVEQLVNHLIDRYGLEDVSSWCFSVWNQPDTPDRLYGFGDDEKSYKFYKRTYQTVKKCNDALSFGLCPTYYVLADGYENWYKKFLEWCKRNSCIPEFLSFTYYDTNLFNNSSVNKDTFGFVDVMSLSINPESFSNFVDQVLNEREMLGFSSSPIYLAEWNNTPSQQDLLSDTCFKSCYVIKNILENYDRLYSFAYWSLTDLMSEAPLPKELFFGGLGMFTVNSIPKPTYYAMKMLTELGDTLIGKGRGWFATKNKNDYIVILYNYRHFSNLYASGERFDMTFTDRYTVFEPEQTLDVHLKIDDVENGEYVISETMVNRKSGSAFDLWVEMGAIEPESSDEISVLTNRSTPMCSKCIKSIDQNTIEFDAILDMLEVRLIRISKK